MFTCLRVFVCDKTTKIIYCYFVKELWCDIEERFLNDCDNYKILDRKSVIFGVVIQYIFAFKYYNNPYLNFNVEKQIITDRTLLYKKML